MFQERRTRAGGSSLIELLIVLAIAGILSAGLYTFFLTISQIYSSQAVVGRMLSAASTAMTRITRDIRGAGTIWSAPCAVLMLMSASNGPPGTITIRMLLDDPAVRTEVAPPPPAGQSQSSSVLRVVSTAGFQVGDSAFITDGIQCSMFNVTQVFGGANPGLQHHPNDDLNSPGGFGYLYPATTSLVYRTALSRQISYTIDASDPERPWLIRNSGAGPVRLVPDIESLSFSYVMHDGSTLSNPATVTTPAQAANIRVVTVRLVARADARDRSMGGDGFRRQTLVSAVKLRNLGP